MKVMNLSLDSDTSVTFVAKNFKKPIDAIKNSRTRTQTASLYLNTLLDKQTELKIVVSDAYFYNYIAIDNTKVNEEKDEKKEEKKDEEKKESCIIKVVLGNKTQKELLIAFLQGKNIQVMTSKTKLVTGIISKIRLESDVETLEKFFKSYVQSLQLSPTIYKNKNISLFKHCARFSLASHDLNAFAAVPMNLCPFSNVLVRVFKNPNPAEALCRKCGKKYHGKSDCTSAFKCLKCGEKHATSSHHDFVNNLHKCFLCDSTSHTGFRCPRAFPQLQPFEFKAHSSNVPYASVARNDLINKNNSLNNSTRAVSAHSASLSNNITQSFSLPHIPPPLLSFSTSSSSSPSMADLYKLIQYLVAELNNLKSVVEKLAEKKSDDDKKEEYILHNSRTRKRSRSAVRSPPHNTDSSNNDSMMQPASSSSNVSSSLSFPLNNSLSSSNSASSSLSASPPHNTDSSNIDSMMQPASSSSNVSSSLSSSINSLSSSNSASSSLSASVLISLPFSHTTIPSFASSSNSNGLLEAFSHINFHTISSLSSSSVSSFSSSSPNTSSQSALSSSNILSNILSSSSINIPSSLSSSNPSNSASTTHA
ncbi:MAG TPA: hypothetical protein VLN45_09825 [Ignavibacteriaceae bacterium]|nr:hypothetical protein [Ignavibacteriaceae bacterium]